MVVTQTVINVNSNEIPKYRGFISGASFVVWGWVKRNIVASSD
jgi:hypothetical protein